MENKKENRQKILIVDDSEMNRSILSDMLSEKFDIVEAADGVQAVSVLQKMHSEIILVMLDIVMPNMDGFDVLAVMNKYHWIDEVPVVMISAENTASYVERAYALGATDYISRPFDYLIVYRRVMNTIMLYAKQKRLMNLVADQMYEKEKSNSMMVSILSHIVEFRNGESGMHVLHIQSITEILLRHLARKTDKYHLSPEEISLMGMASALHDIGKISIPDHILNKPGKLSPEEFDIMKTHAAVGAEMLTEMPGHTREPLMKLAYEICRWHHERHDGSGYPDGLKGDEIPLSAQIVSIADVYDALTSERVYKPPFSHEEALRMILNGECGPFDPLLLECLSECADQIRDVIFTKSDDPGKENKLHHITEELQHQQDELTVSSRTLNLLEHERTKYQFFASMSREIQFEYTVDPDMVMISEWGAKKLGISEIVMNPRRDEQVIACVGEHNLEKLSAVLRTTTPQNPVIQIDCEITIGGEKRWTRVICRAMWSSEEPARYTGAIGKMIDIHEEHTHLQDLEHKASYDALTGLLNHANARRKIEEQMKSHPERNYALAIFDLDHFKNANDNYGHIFGDQVLKCVAEKLSRSIRENDIAARVGGDEFLIFMEYRENLPAIIHRIFSTLMGEYENFPISISMGVTRTEVVGMDYDVLFHSADQALYAVKRSGRGRYEFFDDSMREMLSVISPIESGETEE